MKISAEDWNASRDNARPSKDRSVPIVFLGGIFLPGQVEEVQRQSRGPVQYAADALQKAFLRGFAEASGSPVRAVSLPFVGSYPKGYRSLWFPARSGEYPTGVPIDGRRCNWIRFATKC